MFDQPELERLLRTNLKRYRMRGLRGDVEVTDIADDGQGHVRVTFADRTDGAQHVVEADYVLGCDGANSVVRVIDRLDDARHEVRPALAGRRRRDRPPISISGTVCTKYATRSVPAPTCASATPAIAGSSGCCLARPPTTSTLSTTLRPLHRAVGEACFGTATSMLVRVTEYTFRAQDRRSLAPGQRLPARRCRTPHATVHRPGHGCRPARRDEPGVEAGRCARRRPATQRPGHLRAGAKTARPSHDSACAERRVVDDRGRRRSAI